jgi:cytochrome c oxidase subunit 3
MELQNNNRRIHPQLFALWISMGSITMLFGAWTSAYIVKQAAGNWLEFPIPTIFYASTFAILLSSITLHTSYNAFKQNQERLYKYMLIVSLILGIAFVAMQYIGWSEMFVNGIDFKGNVSGSFFYLITGGHAAHVCGGIAAIVVAIIHAFSLPFKPSEKRRHRFEMVLHYWHFVDALWIYLLIFMISIK